MALRSEETLIDPWSFLDYKGTFGGRKHGPAGYKWADGWVGDHWRRLSAYKMLEAYCRNSARQWLDGSVIDTEDIDNRREYGDPAVAVETIVDSILGDTWSIGVDDDNKQQLELLNKWAKDERFTIKVIHNETQTVKLGDSCVVLNWDEDMKRPVMTVWDPGFYFPVLDPAAPDDEFPLKVHIAYEWEETDDSGNTTAYLRRQTWEMIQVEGGKYNHPWNDGPTDWTCLYSDMTWKLEDLRDDLFDLSTEKATVYEDELDLEIDFMPVVHFPNTIAGPEHFGVSSLSRVMQVFDDLVSTDTDLQAASATTGSPPIVIGDASIAKDEKGRVTTYGPGTLLEVGDGTATMIDTSRSLDALSKYDKDLLERLSVNIRIPEAMLGRVKPSEVPSGIALALGFAPHGSMVKKHRLVRDEKYQLVLKFVCRFFMQDKKLTKISAAKIIFGSFMPADKKETLDLVVQAVSANIIALDTGVKMLMAAGFPIEDAIEEVKKIIERDYESASEFINAGGTVDEARENLLNLGPLPEQELPALGDEDPELQLQQQEDTLPST